MPLKNPDSKRKAADPIFARYHRIIVEHVSDVICVHNKAGSFEFASPSIFDVIGFQPDEVAGQSPYDLIHPKDAEKFVRPAHEKALHGQKEIFRCRIRHKDGHYVWVETTTDSVRDQSGDVIFITTSSRDLTRRKALEDRLKLFEIIVEKASEAILVTDPEEKIIYANPAFLEQTGYAFEEVCGMVPGDFLQGEETDPDIVLQMKNCVDRREVGNFEVLNYKKSGESFHVRLLIQPIFDQQGHHQGFFSMQQDITESIRSRQGLERLNHELSEKNHKLAQLNKDLEHFAYVASHDLKEPLRNIVGLMDLLKESAAEKLDEEELELLEFSQESSDRLSKMIESLLDYSRTGSTSEKPDPVDLQEIIDSLGIEFSRQLGEVGGTVNYFGRVRVITAYPSAFRRLLQNLLSNAIKHGKTKNLKIDIAVEERPDHWEILFKDNGQGIPESHRNKVFQLFNRLSESRESNGIGLAMCKRIAELHHGSIQLLKSDSGGAGFRVVISKHLGEA